MDEMRRLENIIIYTCMHAVVSMKAQNKKVSTTLKDFWSIRG